MRIPISSTAQTKSRWASSVYNQSWCLGRGWRAFFFLPASLPERDALLSRGGSLHRASRGDHWIYAFHLLRVFTNNYYMHA